MRLGYIRRTELLVYASSSIQLSPMKLQIVPASTGVQWVQAGLRTFKRQPMALCALFTTYLLCLTLISTISQIFSVIPGIGSFLALLGPLIALGLLPAISLTMMVAASEAAHDRRPQLNLLLVAFRGDRARTRAMIELGVFYVMGLLLIIGLSAVFDGGNFANIYLGRTPLTKEIAETDGFQTAMLACMILYLPLSMLFWHAPSLVYWHNVPPVKALFFSIVACLRNLGAFVVYFLAWVAVAICLAVAMSLVIGLLSFVLPLGLGFMNGLSLMMAVLLITPFFTSIVFTFRDCFAPPDASDQASSDSSSINTTVL